MSTNSTPTGVNGPPPTDDSSDAESRTDAMTDSDLGRVLLFGLVVGTPMMFAVVVGLCVLAGLGIGDALAVAVMPAVFSSIFFGGIFPLMRHCARHERAIDEARAAPPVVLAPDDAVQPVVPAAG